MFTEITKILLLLNPIICKLFEHLILFAYLQGNLLDLAHKLAINNFFPWNDFITFVSKLILD